MRALLVMLTVLAPLRGPDTLMVASARGVRHVPVLVERGFPAVASAQMGAVLAWESAPSPAGTVTLRVGGESFVFVLEAGYFRSGDRVFTLAAVPYIARDSLFVPLQFVVEYLPRLTGRYRYDAASRRLDELPDRADGRQAAPDARFAAADPAPGSARPPAPVNRRPRTPGPRRRVIAVDAGHGGVDVGMTGPLGGRRFLQENDVTLAIARDVAAELESRGFTTVLTRDRDTLIALGDRGRIAGRAGADVFVSIHVNAANPRWPDAASARGFETYFLAEARTEDEARVAAMENASVRFETNARAERGDPMSFILADLAQNEHLRESSQMAELVQQSLGHVHPAVSRGVKQALYMVLATSYMPAILVETGFGSNAAEARYLTSAAGQQRIARAVAEGVERYLAEYERRVAAGQ